MAEIAARNWRINPLGSLLWASLGVFTFGQEPMMRQDSSYVFPGAFAPILSLDELCAHPDQNSGAKGVDLSDPDPLPDELLDRQQTQEFVQAFVAGLSSREQEVVRRLFWEDRTQGEVAALLNLSRMTVSKTLRKIREKGRMLLTPVMTSALIH